MQQPVQRRAADLDVVALSEKLLHVAGIEVVILALVTRQGCQLLSDDSRCLVDRNTAGIAVYKALKTTSMECAYCAAELPLRDSEQCGSLLPRDFVGHGPSEYFRPALLLVAQSDRPHA